MKRLFLPCLISAILAPAAHALIDTNGNGLSDIWERNYNNNQLFAPTNPAHAPGADPDGDGWTNLQESVAGTNPFNSNAPRGRIGIAIAQIPAVYEPQDAHSLPPPENPPGGSFQQSCSGGGQPAPHPSGPAQNTLTWPIVAGKIYRVECSAGVGAGSWIPASGWFHAEGLPLSYATETLHGDGTHPDKLFWRIAVADTDSDGDTLTDWEEHQLQTDPFSIDTDRDGIPDNLDPFPRDSATYADPDGLGLPASLANGLIGRVCPMTLGKKKELLAVCYRRDTFPHVPNRSDSRSNRPRHQGRDRAHTRNHWIDTDGGDSTALSADCHAR